MAGLRHPNKKRKMRRQAASHPKESRVYQFRHPGQAPEQDSNLQEQMYEVRPAYGTRFQAIIQSKKEKLFSRQKEIFGVTPPQAAGVMSRLRLLLYR
jgi:hypothetical protein